MAQDGPGSGESGPVSPQRDATSLQGGAGKSGRAREGEAVAGLVQERERARGTRESAVAQMLGEAVRPARLSTAELEQRLAAGAGALARAVQIPPPARAPLGLVNVQAGSSAAGMDLFGTDEEQADDAQALGATLLRRVRLRELTWEVFAPNQPVPPDPVAVGSAVVTGHATDIVTWLTTLHQRDLKVVLRCVLGCDERNTSPGVANVSETLKIDWSAHAPADYAGPYSSPYNELDIRVAYLLIFRAEVQRVASAVRYVYFVMIDPTVAVSGVWSVAETAVWMVEAEWGSREGALFQEVYVEPADTTTTATGGLPAGEASYAAARSRSLPFERELSHDVAPMAFESDELVNWTVYVQRDSVDATVSEGSAARRRRAAYTLTVRGGSVP